MSRSVSASVRARMFDFGAPLAERARRRWASSIPAMAMRRSRDLELDTHALALCAQQVLCVAPLVVALSAVLNRESGEDMGKVTAKFFGLKHEAGAAVIAQLGRPQLSISSFGLLFSLVTAVVFSTSVGSVQQRAFELIWSLPRRRGIRAYVRQLVWALALAAFCVGMLFANIVGKYLSFTLHPPVSIGFLTGMILQSALVFVFYAWSQNWLLDRRVAFADVVPGAVAIAIGTAVMFRVSREIIPQQIVWQTHAYGAIGVIFVLSAWLMALCMVIFGGAVVGALVAERRAQRESVQSATVPNAEAVKSCSAVHPEGVAPVAVSPVTSLPAVETSPVASLTAADALPAAMAPPVGTACVAAEPLVDVPVEAK